MYDELVKRLRARADREDDYYEHGGDVIREAAYAIDKLSKRIDRAVELYNRGVERSAMYEALVGIAPEPPKEEKDNAEIKVTVDIPALEKLAPLAELYRSSRRRLGVTDSFSDPLVPAADVVERPRWIPVTERLPEERKAVIVWEPRYLNPYICVLSEGEWYVFGGYGVKVFGVTHWMPLPQPPKEET